ncbi:hypothetical protein AAF712_016761, partial [Marasmius tenuissimus]
EDVKCRDRTDEDGEEDVDDEVSPGKKILRLVVSRIQKLTGYRFNYKTKRISKSDSNMTTYVYYCAQLDGQQTKNKKVSYPKKQRLRSFMQRFKCDGWLQIAVNERDLALVEIRLTHYHPHIPYVDISIPDSVKEEIEQMKASTAGKIWAALKKYPKTNFTQKQVYYFWSMINEGIWKLDSNQVESAILVLKKACSDGVEVEIIPTPVEDGISSLAFTFMGILDGYGENVHELAMDSTCKYRLLAHT